MIDPPLFPPFWSLMTLSFGLSFASTFFWFISFVSTWLIRMCVASRCLCVIRILFFFVVGDSFPFCWLSFWIFCWLSFCWQPFSWLSFPLGCSWLSSFLLVVSLCCGLSFRRQSFRRQSFCWQSVPFVCSWLSSFLLWMSLSFGLSFRRQSFRRLSL
jgi:hypothetical protein